MSPLQCFMNGSAARGLGRIYRQCLWHFACLCFFKLLPLPFLAIPVALVSVMWFVRHEICRVYYLSFSNLHHVITDVCPQEKAETWETYHLYPFKIWTSLQNLPFLLRHHIVSFVFFLEFLFIFWKVSLLGVYSIILQTKSWE